jgi:hypothetical protein
MKVEMTDSEWYGLVRAANSLQMVLAKKPGHLKAGISYHPGSILNAYREGDVTFEEGVKLLTEWKEMK